MTNNNSNNKITTTTTTYYYSFTVYSWKNLIVQCVKWSINMQY